MSIIEQRQQFTKNSPAVKIRRTEIKSAKTALLVILHPDKYKAKTQLKFPWRGITQFICVVGAREHNLSRVEVTQMITDVGGGFPPTKFFLEFEGLTCTKQHTEWFASIIKSNKITLENIIINCAGGFPFLLEDKINTLLPPKYGGKINLYHTDDIERRSR